MKKLIRASLAALFVGIVSQTATASTFSYEALLSGPAESPPNASPGTGFATVGYDSVSHLMAVHIDFSGLLGTTTASHIHSATPTPGTGTALVATVTPSFTGFPLGVTAGTYDQTFDMSLLASYNPAFVTANGGTAATAEAALFSGIAAGEAYLNIHTSVVPGGEIRGFLEPVPSTVPLPAGFSGGLALLGAVAGLQILNRRVSRA